MSGQTLPRLVVCAGCHSEVVRRVSGGRSDAGRYCSRECAFSHMGAIAGERAALRRMGQRERQAGRARQVAVARERREHILAAKRQRVCCDCGNGFEQRTHEGRPEKRCTSCAAAAKQASEAVGRRAAKARRRAVERGAKADRIDPLLVFARDGWCCQLCQSHLQPEDRGTHKPKAPELDHIIPLAAGGMHTWANVQCACRECNNRKGATVPMAA